MSLISRRLVCGLVATAALAAGATSASAKTLDVVVAGDDYAAGNGAGAYTDATCGRTTRDWGNRYASAVRARGITVNLSNVACTGAKVADLDAQLLQVTPDTDLVAFTIGANDLGFAAIVRRCFTPLTSSPADCEAAVTAAQGVFPAIGASLRALKTRLRPGGNVVVISYPYIASPNGFVLRGPRGASYDAGAAVRSLQDTLDFVAANGVDGTNAIYRDNSISLLRPKADFAGHEPDPNPFRDNPQSWIWEFSGVRSPLDIYRLNPAGHAKIASLLFNAGGIDGDFGAAQ